MRKLRLFTAIFFAVAVIGYGIFTVYERVFEDNTPPVITSETDVVECSVNGDVSELMAGLTAYDSKDGDITENIMVESVSPLVNKDTAKITYVVFDSANNVGRFTRNVRYTDYELPRFSISSPMIFAKGADVSIFEKISATDVIDKDISNNIRVTSQNLDNTVEGEYSITVQVTNSMGDTSSLPLTVIINSESVRKQLIMLKEYLVYIEEGSGFNAWNYVESVHSADGGTKAITVVDIESNVDTSKNGVYEVRYSYSNGGYDYTTILTVVVE